MFHFTIRDLLWLTVVGMGAGWWVPTDVGKIFAKYNWRMLVDW